MNEKPNTIKTKIFYLKNMNSSCCFKLIRLQLQNIKVEIGHIIFGEVRLSWDETKIKEEAIVNIFKSNGFPVIKDKDQQLIEKIKIAVIELIHYSGYKSSIIRNSDYLVDKLAYSYQHLSTVFSNYENITLEKYIILNKIEKVKELLENDELTLSEIAFQLEYSSVQYLSTQFKNITGITVSEYKKENYHLRIPLEKLSE